MCCAHIVYVLLIHEIEFMLYKHNEIFVENDDSFEELGTLYYRKHFEHNSTI